MFLSKSTFYFDILLFSPLRNISKLFMWFLADYVTVTENIVRLIDGNEICKLRNNRCYKKSLSIMLGYWVVRKGRQEEVNKS